MQSSKNIYSIFRGRWCLFVYFSVKGFLHLSKYYHVFTYCGFGNIFLDNIGIRLLWTTHRLLPRPLLNARLPTHQVWKTDHWPPLEPAAHRPRKPSICLDDRFHFWFFPFMASASISPISFASLSQQFLNVFFASIRLSSVYLFLYLIVPLDAAFHKSELLCMHSYTQNIHPVLSLW